eukprot:COSAG05_NODE_1283_length_5283_cov_2.297261_2_plen_615_part_00
MFCCAASPKKDAHRRPAPAPASDELEDEEEGVSPVAKEKIQPDEIKSAVADLTSIRKKKDTQFQDKEDRDHDDVLRIANFAAQPARTAQPEAGLNAALGSAFNTSGTSTMLLHQAIEKWEWHKAALLITPETAREMNMVGDLPLHVATKAENGFLFRRQSISIFRAPAEFVLQLLAAYPEAARENDKDGSLPLHYAVRNRAPAEVVGQLLAAYPQAARGTLHWALESLIVSFKGSKEVSFKESDNATEIVGQLLSAYPQAAREKDMNGCLPLHFALENLPPLRLAAKNQALAEVVVQLVTAYPEAAREKDKDGNLPLHLAAKNQALAEVVAQLVAAYPDAAREKDKDGNLPLHYAVSYSAAEVVAQLRRTTSAQLLLAYPQAALQQTKEVLNQASAEVSALVNAVAGKGTALSLHEVSIPDDGSLGRLLANTPQLTELSLQICGLAMLPPQLGQLTALRTLDLSDNALADGPMALAGLTGLSKLQTLRLSGMPSLSQLANISDEQGAQAALAFVRDAYDDPHRDFSLKLVLAGPTCAGKSSLLRALLGREERLMGPDERTIGLDIEELSLPYARAEEGDVHFLAYDAGGHDEVRCWLLIQSRSLCALSFSVLAA